VPKEEEPDVDFQGDHTYGFAAVEGEEFCADPVLLSLSVNEGVDSFIHGFRLVRFGRALTARTTPCL
jgi:hypothetical protein